MSDTAKIAESMLQISEKAREELFNEWHKTHLDHATEFIREQAKKGMTKCTVPLTKYGYKFSGHRICQVFLDIGFDVCWINEDYMLDVDWSHAGKREPIFTER